MMNEEFEREVVPYQVDTQVLTRSIKDDTPEQIADIEWFIEQKVDVLIVLPNESETCAPVIEKAYQRGILMALVDRKIATESYTAYVGTSNYQVGKEAGFYTIDVLKDKGNIVEMRDTKDSIFDAERREGFIDTLAKAPEIRIVVEVQGNYLFDEAEKQLWLVSQRHSNIGPAFAMDDPMAAGVRQAAIQPNGKLPFTVGIDVFTGGGIKNIENNVQDVSFIYPTGGEKVIDLTMKTLCNQSFRCESILSTTMVDKSSVHTLQLQIE